MISSSVLPQILRNERFLFESFNHPLACASMVAPGLFESLQISRGNAFPGVVLECEAPALIA
jgi:hypothetical protein